MVGGLGQVLERFGYLSAERPTYKATLLRSIFDTTALTLAELVTRRMLENLAPAERLAFVLHDMFAVPFDEIAPIVGRTPAAARQLASRARRRVQGAPMAPNAELSRQREVVDAFLAAARGGDLDGLLAVLAPDVVLRNDRAAAPAGAPREIHGAAEVARRAFVGRARAAQAALVNGAVGVVVAPRGRLVRALRFTIANGKITEIEVIGNPVRLGGLDVSIVD